MKRLIVMGREQLSLEMDLLCFLQRIVLLFLCVFLSQLNSRVKCIH